MVCKIIIKSYDMKRNKLITNNLIFCEEDKNKLDWFIVWITTTHTHTHTHYHYTTTTHQTPNNTTSPHHHTTNKISLAKPSFNIYYHNCPAHPSSSAAILRNQQENIKKKVEKSRLLQYLIREAITPEETHIFHSTKFFIYGKRI